jgi:hypothetical protein
LFAQACCRLSACTWEVSGMSIAFATTTPPAPNGSKRAVRIATHLRITRPLVSAHSVEARASFRRSWRRRAVARTKWMLLACGQKRRRRPRGCRDAWRPCNWYAIHSGQAYGAACDVPHFHMMFAHARAPPRLLVRAGLRYEHGCARVVTYPHMENNMGASQSQHIRARNSHAAYRWMEGSLFWLGT